MSDTSPFAINPKLDLVLERRVSVPPALVWEAWTQPEHLKQWFCPRPWSVAACEIDLRPGGLFPTVMQSPDGELMPTSDGCYLEVEPHRRLVWTSAMGPGYRPVQPGREDDLLFTAFILIEPEGDGSRYTAIAVHPDPAGKARHEAMGFHEGWATALEQLVEYMRGLSH